jgi:hypothetical protein
MKIQGITGGFRRAWPGWIATLLLFTGVARAYDLTPDRGALSASLSSSNSYVSFYVWNVGSNDWGPVNNCNTTWANAQWRGEDGKLMGSVVPKTVIYQTDFHSLTNGWFTPNPSRPNAGCSGSHISRGWDDEYGNNIQITSGFSHSVKPTLFVRVDPNNFNTADESQDNNQVWVTTQWNAAASLFQPMENLDLTAGTTSLTASDTLLYGAYSTNSANGNITINNQTRTTSLIHGNEKVGYQGRRMTVTLTGGAANTYNIQSGSVVRAEFLGQNTY